MVKRKEAKAVDSTLRLTVEIDEHGIPKFEFSGLWNVREILKVERTLNRRYREYMLSLRKSSV